jgi:pimeloyl-ACP methyl ester carboxylesterase
MEGGHPLSKSNFKIEYLNDQINELIRKCDHKRVAMWACDCAEHVLEIFEKEHPQDKRPRQAIDACRAWINDEISMWNARKFAFPAHASAREADSDGARAAARACGHAIGTAHVVTHAPHCATYAAKAVGYVNGDVKREREWQYNRLLRCFMEQAIKSVQLSNQVMLHYFEKGSPTGIPLILLHGFADSWHTFDLILPYLPEFIHTFALSQRGHGDSSRPEHGYRTEDFVDDLELFMNAVHIEKAVLCGASSGGFVARSFAMNHPERTLGLVLLGSPSELSSNPQIQAAWDSTISKLTDPIDPAFVRAFVNGMFSKPVPPDFLETIFKENLKVPARVWVETCRGLLDEPFPGMLSKVDVSTSIIWGDQDTILTLSDQTALLNEITGSKLVVIPGAGHALYWEEPELVASALVAFLHDIVDVS